MHMRSVRRLSHWLVLGLLVGMLGFPGFAPSVVRAEDPQPPEKVVIPGTIQSKAGCAGDWQPDCDSTALAYDKEDDVWQGSFSLPAGDYEYKVALNGSWDVNYGLNAVSGGPNIPLALTAGRKVKFYYDHKTHWVIDNVNGLIVTAVGDFQSELGCAKDGDAGCLRSWLVDPAGVGAYAFVTTLIPPGTYHVAVALDENGKALYGQGGKEGGEPYTFTVEKEGTEVYFGYDAATHELIVSTEGAPRGDLSKARAHWVRRDLVLWSVPAGEGYQYRLHYAADGDLELGLGEILGGESIPLTLDPVGAEAETLAKFPYLAKMAALRVDPTDLAKVPEALKGALAVSVWDKDGKLVDATGVQIPGVLDDLYTYEGALGIVWDAAGIPGLRLWAPTARSVTLHLFESADAEKELESIVMTWDPATGVWSAAGTAEWENLYYLYEVEVFVPSTGKIERNLVTDPYSFSLSMNSKRSQIVNLTADAALQPEGWAGETGPALGAPEDIVLYELHIRDFSVHDETVPENYRGTFMAFTVSDSNGMKHLQGLSKAGLTHIHLLPAFDIASVNEDKSTWESPTEEDLASYPSDSEKQQEALAPYRDRDGFNWGYDPLHYTVPEGSYSTDPNGPTRIREFRSMVQSLHKSGLRVVMDVVYNHTNANGQNEKSVLDRIVPGYYHRLNLDGKVENSTCCSNTATEHAMMKKLMIDSVVTWVTEYHVDGFRFDLMGHHMLQDMVDLRKTLDALPGGQSVYIYGEGWDFGEVAQNARGVNATQLNIGGTGIGVFNDRLRDGARGGGPFSGLQEQGFLTGLFVDSNAIENAARTELAQRVQLLRYTDWIKVGLAGNLKDYTLINADGKEYTGYEIKYKEAHAGYTLDPQENINYVSAHDNETLFDAIQLKVAEETPLQDRVRMQELGISVVMLGQGIPFFHAGDELLRSKSMDRNSYNSGDWFNRLDFTYATNNWGVGLPPADNQGNWPLMQSLLANKDLQPGAAEIKATLAHFQEMLQIRKSSSLFRMRTAEEIKQNLVFLNAGSKQIPGLIVMQLNDTGNLDPNYDLIVTLFNADKKPVEFTAAELKGLPLTLHPVQAVSADESVREAAFDPATGTFKVPGRTTAVFVSTEGVVPQVTSTPTAVPTATPVPAGSGTPTATPVALAASGPNIPGLVILGVGALALVVGIYFWFRPDHKNTRHHNKKK